MQDIAMSRNDDHANGTDIQVLEDAFARQVLDDVQAVPAAISENTTLKPVTFPQAARPEHPNLTEPQAAAAATTTTTKATFMGVPIEIRQRILSLTLSTLAPMSPSNGDYLASLPRSRSIRIKTIRRYTASKREAIRRGHPAGRRNFSPHERRSYLALTPLYLVNRQMRAEMRYVERAWLLQHARMSPLSKPLSLAAFAAWAAAPVPVNGILTLSLFNTPFVANPPPEWEAAVRSLIHEENMADPDQQHLQELLLREQNRGIDRRHGHMDINGRWPCDEYLRAWRQTVMQPSLLLDCGGLTVARRYGIEAVEMVDVRRCLLTAKDQLVEHVGWVKDTELGRLEILLLKRLGLPMERVRISSMASDARNAVLAASASAIRS